MKKFMKVCGIMAAVFLVVGLVLMVSTGAVSGLAREAGEATERIRHLVKGEAWKDSYMDSSLEEEREIMSQVGEQLSENLQNADYDIKDKENFNSEQPVANGEIERYEIEEAVTSLDIEAGACQLVTRKAENQQIAVEASGMKRFQCYVEEGTLYIKAEGKDKLWSEGRNQVILYLPEEISFLEAALDVGAGKMELSSLTAQKLALEAGAGQILLDEVFAGEVCVEVGAGQILIQEMEADSLDVEVGMGNFSAAADLTGDGKIDCSMGSVVLLLDGRKQDFNYTLSNAMGSITLGEQSIGTVAGEYQLDNEAEKNMDIQCAMGSTEITFR